MEPFPLPPVRAVPPRLPAIGIVGPLVVPALLAGRSIGLDVWLFLIAASLVVVAATSLLSGRRRIGRLCDPILLLAAVVLGVGWGGTRTQPAPLPQESPELLLRGTACRWREGEVENLRFFHDGRWFALPGRFLWRHVETAPGAFLARGHVVGFDRRHPPGLADPDRRARWRGLRGSILPREVWPLPEDRGGAIAGNRYRSQTRAVLAGRLGESLPPWMRSLAARVLWGDRSRLDGETERIFRATGTVHLLAISGLHVGIFALLAEFLLRLVVRHPIVRTALLLFPLTGYTFLVGPQPSVVRACIMAVCLLAGRAIGRPGGAGAGWWAALLFVACFVPEDLVSPGGQLSFVATAALILRPALPRGADPLGASVAATAATSGVLWAHFGAVAPLAVAANLIAVPGLAPLLIALLWGIAWGNPADPTLQALAWGPARLVTEAWVGPLALLTPIGEATMVRVSCGLLPGLGGSLLFLLLLFAARRHLHRRSIRIVLPTVLLVPFLAASARGSIEWKPRHDLEAHVLPVGQGDATLLRTRCGRTYLVDTGPGGRDGLQGRRSLAPAIRSFGVERIDGLFLTHGDEDHVGGLRGLLLAGIRVDTLYLSLGDATRLRLPRSRVPPVRVVAHPWQRTIGNVSLCLLAPRVDRHEELGNEGSLVFRIEAPGGSLILPGDLGRAGEEALVASGDLEPATVLLAAHHGSSGSTGRGWRDRIDPRLVLISCGPYNRHGHPAPELLRRLEERGIPVRRTDRDGLLSLRWSGGALRFRCGGCSDWCPVL